MSDLYGVLGVSKDASDSEIKKAYRALSLKYHPDRNSDPEAKSKFQEISAAYETLSDPAKKMQYEAERNGMHFGGGGGGMPMDGFADINNIFEMMFNGMPPGMGMHRMGSMGPDIHIFNGGMQFGHGGPGNIFHALNKPPPIIKNIIISLNQSYTGVTVPIEIDRWIIQMNAKVFEKETIYINIPAGIDENEMIIMRDRGNIVNDQLKGDIKICIQIEKHPHYERVGMDIIYKKKITLKESLCGFSFDIIHLSGQNLCLNNNTNKTIIRPNYKKVIPQLGMNRDGNVGNLIIAFDVEFPESLNEDQICELEKIL